MFGVILRLQNIASLAHPPNRRRNQLYVLTNQLHNWVWYMWLFSVFLRCRFLRILLFYRASFGCNKDSLISVCGLNFATCFGTLQHLIFVNFYRTTAGEQNIKNIRFVESNPLSSVLSAQSTAIMYIVSPFVRSMYIVSLRKSSFAIESNEATFVYVVHRFAAYPIVRYMPFSLSFCS